MNGRRAALILLCVTLAIPFTLFTAAAEDCDPYPVGRCGAFQREQVGICWLPQTGQQWTDISPTDTNAIVVTDQQVAVPGLLDVPLPAPGTPQGVYVRLTPVENFLADPMHAPLPTKSVWRETNNRLGLQPTSFACGVAVWYAECHPPQWMMLSSPTAIGADTILA